MKKPETKLVKITLKSSSKEEAIKVVVRMMNMYKLAWQDIVGEYRKEIGRRHKDAVEVEIARTEEQKRRQDEIK